MPEYVITDFENSVRQNPQLMRDIMQAYYDQRQSPEERAEKIEEMFSQKPTTEVLQIFLYLILFSVFMVLAAVIATMLQNKMFFNIQKSTDHAMGGFIGLLEAGSMIVLLTLIARLLVLLGGGKFLFFNDEELDNTFLFSFFYRNIRMIL